MKKSWKVLGAAGVLAMGVGSWSLASGTNLVPGTVSPRPEEDASYKKAMDAAGPTLVTVKFVLKIEGGGDMSGLGDQEMEATGFLLDGKGLVVCSNIQMGGYASFMARGGTVTPTDVKVLIGDDTEGKKAKVLTRDTELDLAWVKLDEDSTTELQHINMEKGVAASIGSKLLLVGHMAKFFDRALFVNEGKVCGVTEKPRKLLAASKTLVTDRSDLGMPVFNSDGDVVGMVVLQLPDAESQASDTSGDLGGGPMILPAAEVVRATKRALENPTPAPAAEKKPEAGAEKKAEEKPAPAKEVAPEKKDKP